MELVHFVEVLMAHTWRERGGGGGGGLSGAHCWLLAATMEVKGLNLTHHATLLLVVACMAIRKK